jgi:hypothetical protein
VDRCCSSRPLQQQSPRRLGARGCLYLLRRGNYVGEEHRKALKPLPAGDEPQQSPCRDIPIPRQNCHPDRSVAEGPAVRHPHKQIKRSPAALPFVIPSEAEGSAVPRTRLGNVFRPRQNCHPDRSVAQWRDLLLAIPITNHKVPSRPPLCHPDPDFLPRGTGHICVCAFVLRKDA